MQGWHFFAIVLLHLALLSGLHRRRCIVHLCATTHPVSNTHGCELTVLLPIYNKAHYLNISLPSIVKLPINPARVCALCYDDGSTDGTPAQIARYQKENPRLFLIRNERNRGTLHARIALIEATVTPWMVFLDADDQFYGRGVVDALTAAIETGADIVQFGCVGAFRETTQSRRCWREPPRVFSANKTSLTQLWLNGYVDVHLHRKIWRTEVFQRAVSEMPAEVKRTYMVFSEDVVLYAYALLAMRGWLQYIKTLGMIRRFGWPDNSYARARRPRSGVMWQSMFALNCTVRLFGRPVRA
jgi:glycosyltransferase involved in cell wall biosynthesis